MEPQKKLKLQNHKVIKTAIKKACKASSVMRATSDVPAAGGIEFEIVLQKEINKSRNKDFPFYAFLNRDLEMHGDSKELIDWLELVSYENYKKKQKTSWNNQSNADIVFFKEVNGKLHFYDAWSLKTTVSLDLQAALNPNNKLKKKTSALDLVNLKDDKMSRLLRDSKDNIKVEKVAGRCLLVICNNGNFSSYFWDGKVSNLCKMIVDKKMKICSDTKKQICFSNDDYSTSLINCSKRATDTDAKPTSFGRSLQICAAPTTKGRKANFMAEEMVDSGVLDKVVSGNFNCKAELTKSFKERLNISINKEEK